MYFTGKINGNFPVNAGRGLPTVREPLMPCEGTGSIQGAAAERGSARCMAHGR